ncbi:alpha/beta hydrolase [Zavarzinella formosa]|uniref:alpha/beta hydrolase n=1 Tax=Zavarzinella formosa TaxID=360055 RepID=UPI00031D29CA|nr:alpha/beta hydrolase [Zavarzinella formosa]
MLSLSLLLASVIGAGEPVVPLWEDGKVPDVVGAPDKNKPTVMVFAAPADKANGAAVVVCPGGGYGFLADDHEGKQVAEFLNGLGVHAFVLKYRIASKERPGPLMNAPMHDVQRAIRYVRANAEKYKIDPKRVGVWGFSAGGHLASTAATHFDAGKADAADPIDKVSCRPDFAILAYPVISMETGTTHGGSRNNLIGAKPDEKLVEFFSNEKQVTKDTPPTYIFHTADDKAVPVENAKKFYEALKKAGVPAELNIHEKGPHGVGLARDPKWTKGADGGLAKWPDQLAAWMKTQGLLEKK